MKVCKEIVHARPMCVLCAVWLIILDETSSGYGWGTSKIIQFFFWLHVSFYFIITVFLFMQSVNCFRNQVVSLWTSV